MGNLEAQRDWGFAGDYVRAMWPMLQQDEPEDFVVATGDSALGARGSARWRSVASGSTTSDTSSIDPELYRPAEVDRPRGRCVEGPIDPRLGAGGRFRALIEMMVDADLARLKVRSDGGSPVEVPSPVAR